MTRSSDSWGETLMLGLVNTGHDSFFGVSLGDPAVPMASPGTSPLAEHILLLLLSWALNLQSIMFPHWLRKTRVAQYLFLKSYFDVHILRFLGVLFVKNAL